MILLPLLLGFAELPVRLPAGAEECPLAIPLVVGQAPPEDLVDPGTWTLTCNAVAVPTSQVAHLLAVQVWAEGQHAISLPTERESVVEPVTAAALGFSAGVLTALLVGSL